MSEITLTRQQLRQALNLAADAAGIYGTDRLDLDRWADRAEVCAVGLFGYRGDPPSCQCPATQAGLICLVRERIPDVTDGYGEFRDEVPDFGIYFDRIMWIIDPNVETVRIKG